MKSAIRILPVLLGAILASGTASAQTSGPTAAAPKAPLTGAAAFGDWTQDLPGLTRKITPADLPAPFATRSAGNGPTKVSRPDGTMPQVPAGFTVTQFASGLDEPRAMRVAPNGDIFVAESYAGRIRVLHATDGAAKSSASEVFASGLDMPFGIAFYPPGPDPKWVYVGNTGSVVRFPYSAGDRKARGPAETIVADIPSGGRLTGGGHWTRDLAFTPDSKTMFVSVGSYSNDGEDMPKSAPSQDAGGLIGAAVGPESRRADVLAFDPDGHNGRIFATGIRNCVGLAIEPADGSLWCSTNERDGLGDNLPPDYITRVKEHDFFGWPWRYIGDHEDPRHKGERSDLAGKARTPDVLLQAHSASLQLVFYKSGGPGAFPADYDGSAFAAEHGSWNRGRRTGYKVIRVMFKDGQPTGEYQDFMTGFVTKAGDVWGRPVGVAVARDGALLVSEDANGTIWRIARSAP